MIKIFLAVLSFIFAFNVHAQVISNAPDAFVGQVDLTLENNSLRISNSVSVQISLSGVNNDQKSSLTCMKSARQSNFLNFLTTQVTIGSETLLGNFTFESFDKCAVVGNAISKSPGAVARFKLILDSDNKYYGNFGKIVSVEWVK